MRDESQILSSGEPLLHKFVGVVLLKRSIKYDQKLITSNISFWINTFSHNIFEKSFDQQKKNVDTEDTLGA